MMSDDMRMNERSFLVGEHIPSAYGGHIRVQESSAAMAPHIWIHLEYPINYNEPHGDKLKGSAHLTLENAIKLRDQITYLINNHYQVE